MKFLRKAADRPDAGFRPFLFRCGGIDFRSGQIEQKVCISFPSDIHIIHHTVRQENVHRGSVRNSADCAESVSDTVNDPHHGI